MNVNAIKTNHGKMTMRSYQIDEFTPEQIATIIKRFTGKGYASAISQLVQIPLPAELWSPEQKEHADSCGPFYMAIETGTGSGWNFWSVPNRFCAARASPTPLRNNASI